MVMGSHVYQPFPMLIFIQLPDPNNTHTHEGDCEALNQDFDKIKDWSSRWNMEEGRKEMGGGRERKGE